MTQFFETHIFNDRQQPLHILDLGCGTQHDWFDLFHAQGFERYHGVDLQPAHHFPENPDQFEFQESTEMNWPLMAYRQAVVHRADALSDEAFNQVFSFTMETAILEFLKDNRSREQADLVVLSNVLHLLPEEEDEQLFDELKHYLKPAGRIYLQALTIANQQLPKPHSLTAERMAAIRHRLKVVGEAAPEGYRAWELIGKLW